MPEYPLTIDLTNSSSYHIRHVHVKENVEFSAENTLIVRAGVHYSGQKNMSQPVCAKAVEVGFGEIQPESTFETLDSPFKGASSQSGN